MTLTATDMEMDIAEQVSCSVAQDGLVQSCSSVERYCQKAARRAEVTVTVADGTASVQAGRSNFTLPTLPVEDFPAFNSSELPIQFAITTADMRHQIDTTRFAISTEEPVII